MVSLKEHLIKKIQETTDLDILEEIYRLLEIDLDDQEVYHLNEDQVEEVREAQNQIKNGSCIREEQANKEVEDWLKRK